MSGRREGSGPEGEAPTGMPDDDLDHLEHLDGRPGVPDALQRLWTPHRMVYVGDTGGDVRPSTGATASCPFCTSPGRSDQDGLIVHRGASAFVVLNLFPYNPGHLLVCTYRHVADLTDLTTGERDEIGALTARAMRVIRGVSAPAGFNLGMNQGAVAGAGIAAHLHQHVVPRWAGDANFLPVIARTKAVPQLLADTRELLASAWDDAAYDDATEERQAGDNPEDDRPPGESPADDDRPSGEKPAQDRRANDRSPGESPAECPSADGDEPSEDADSPPASPLSGSRP